MRLRLLIEAGHGNNYRAPRETDAGFLTEQGDTEHEIVVEYARILRGEACLKKHAAGLIYNGCMSSRMKMAIARKAEALVSLHLEGDHENTAPRTTVLYHTYPSQRLALNVMRALSDAFPGRTVDIFCVEPTGENRLLEFNPSIQIQIANITSQQDLRDIRSRVWAGRFAQAVLSGIETTLQPGSADQALNCAECVPQ